MLWTVVSMQAGTSNTIMAAHKSMNIQDYNLLATDRFDKGYAFTWLTGARGDHMRYADAGGGGAHDNPDQSKPGIGICAGHE